MTTATNTIGAAYAAELEQENVATRRILEAVPGDKLTWKPHEKSMTLGVLAMHIAGNAAVISDMLNADGMDTSDMAGMKTPQSESKQQVLDTFDAASTKAAEFLGAWNDEAAGQMWTMTNGDATIMSMPRAALARMILLSHLYHHRGQLGVYLRLLDVPVPSVYGPTADDNPFA